MSSSKRKGFMRGFLAGTAMIGFLAVIAFLAVKATPPGNKDFFNISLMALINFVGIAFGYYLGSSEGSAAKNDMLASTMVTPTPPATNRDDSGQAGFISVPLLALIAGLFLILAIAACSGPALQKSANSLILTQETVVAAAQAADSMCTAGTLTQDQCDEVAKLYSQARDAYTLVLTAELAVIDAAIAGDTQAEEESRQVYSVALSGFTQVATQLVAMATKYGFLEDSK